MMRTSTAIHKSEIERDYEHNLFSPPFYNRPPLSSRSASLTSLLAAQSRFQFGPGTHTPDSSDNESSIDRASRFARETSIAERSKSHGAATLLISEGGKAGEYYGFVMYLSSSVALIGYLVWAAFPSSALHYFGVFYYPDR